MKRDGEEVKEKVVSCQFSVISHRMNARPVYSGYGRRPSHRDALAAYRFGHSAAGRYILRARGDR